MFKKIGLRIRRVRMDQAMKQKDLARKIGISQGALTNFELGRRKISLEWLVKISRILETPVSYFLIDVEPRRDESTLGPKDLRMLRAFQKISNDSKLQSDFLHTLERMGHHQDRKGGKGHRGR